MGAVDFHHEFHTLTGFSPLRWQERLFFEWLMKNRLPAALDLPTGLGKTSVIALWHLARRAGASLPRRLVYVVDRRTVVDQATRVAEEIKTKAQDPDLRISTLRGQFADNREWLEDPAAEAIIVGTVDMIGSRLLFSGYGISRRMRPFHAGLLGADSLVILDEAHLIPSFEALIATVENEHRAPAPVPALSLVSLSATGREREGEIFRLEDEDLQDEIIQQRLTAKKWLTIDLAEDALKDALSNAAWEISSRCKAPTRVLLYCDSRETAQKTEQAIRARADREGREIVTELFVGARRVKERMEAERRLLELGFLAGHEEPPERPTFLIATSAGEVGVDLDADHMVCDLVPFERMVQRLGRVNRRGDREAQVLVLHEGEPRPKKPEAPNEKERRLLVAWAALPILRELPHKECGFDASPGALMELARRPALRERIKLATTPTPLRPPLNRPLLDAWAMTSLKAHTGRPEVTPWIRGWVEKEAQTTVIWRRFLPVREAGSEPRMREVTGFFEAAPPYLSEMLETATYRVVPWLLARAEAMRKSSHASKGGAVFILEPDGELRRHLRMDEVIEYSRDKWHKERLEELLTEGILIVDARLGGLANGLLDEKVDEEAETADGESSWAADVGFRIRSSEGSPSEPNGGWHESLRFDIERSEEGTSLRCLVIDGRNEERRAESSHPQLLDEHQAQAAQVMRYIAERLGLSEKYLSALCLAAGLHDEGKRAERWQRAFRAARDRRDFGLEGPLAKTRGPINQALLDGYRHEFGSIPCMEKDPGLVAIRTCDLSLADLVLHLIAAHHGGGRPIISTKSCDDAPPSALEARARDTALRFARLERQWGPWGLAWWESLLRAADQQASRQNDRRKTTRG